MDGTKCSLRPHPTERFELRTRRERHTHELNLIVDPDAVVMERSKFHGPEPARARITAIECARDHHVLGADEERGAVEIFHPSRRFDTSHQEVDRDIEAGVLDPSPRVRRHLIGEYAHREDKAEAQRPTRVLALYAMIEPREDHSGAFPQAGRNPDE